MFTAETIDFSSLDENQIKEKLKEYCLLLTVNEIKKIQNEILKRPPSLAECMLWSIQGSEHSSYKSSRPFLKQLPTDAPNVILGPSEDAGVVEICRDKENRRYGVVVSHESHNHPSQIVPYEGAATGIGGNVRDVCCMGAKVIANADPLRFGDISRRKTRLIHEGVVAGIAGYGNPIGVPVLAGDIYYDESYNENCLVNVVSLGVLREDELIHSRAPQNAAGYDMILVGKPTDNSGFGGASFASLELKEEEKEQNKGAVQEPNAFLKRHLLKSTYDLFKILKEKNFLAKVGFKDLGAGGIACASVELADAAGYGAELDLDLVPKGMENLHPWVILCSETQERFMWVAAPEITPLIINHYNNTFNLPKVSQGAEAKAVGKIRVDGQYVVIFQGVEIVNARAQDVTRGLLYQRAYSPPAEILSEPDIAEPADYNEIFLKILAHQNVASRAPVYEQYDKQVQGITVLEAGRGDAGVIQPFKDESYPLEIRRVGVALTVDHNPRYNKIDPYWGAINAVAEAMRNIVAVGARPIAITDCLCYGNPEKPEQMWQFAQGVRGIAEACKNIHLQDWPDSPTPVVSGNVSLYNESGGKAIAPSPVIACLGKLDDVSEAIDFNLKRTNSVLLMAGERKNELGGSVYYDLYNELGVNLPRPDFGEVEKQNSALIKAVRAGLVVSAHDISDGGLAVALAEMSFANEIGLEIEIPGSLRNDWKLFSETGGFVLEVEKENLAKVKNIFSGQGTAVFEIGNTTAEPRLKMNGVIDLDLRTAKKEWSEGLRKKL